MAGAGWASAARAALSGYLKNSAKNKSMKKHIEDLRNALYKRDLTVAAEEDTPAFPAVWTLVHPYFTLPLTIAFHSGTTPVSCRCMPASAAT